MKLYITKWSLTAGIIEVDSERLKLNKSLINAYWYGKYTETATPISFYVGKDIFENINEAKNEAETMRDKKIESLKKQIKKLESKTF